MKMDALILGATAVAILVIPLATVWSSGVETPAPEPISTTEGYTQTPIFGGISAIAPNVSKSNSKDQTQHDNLQSSEGTSSSSSVVYFLPQAGSSESSSVQSTNSESNTPESKATEAPLLSDGNIVNGTYKIPYKAFKILNLSTGKVEEVSVSDYVCGAIAAEMPATFHSEALKAQGVAALSYAIFNAQMQEKNPSPELKGAHFSADPNNRKGYMPLPVAKKFYGENWKYNWEKVGEAAKEAEKYVLTYAGAPIAAAYHAISSGNTESAVNIWGNEMPYLVPVDSSCDILANGYKSSVVLSQSEIKENFKDTEITLLPNTDTWFEILERSESGYVTAIRVGNKEMSGNMLRNLLGLRSSCFQIERQGKDFLFLVTGYGHGAGLSQNGADYMARQGKNFKEILQHYYTGAEILPAKI